MQISEKNPEIISKIDILKQKIREWKKQGNTIGLVPTMGALHIGHKSLIDKARKQCDKVVVSIFVNPTQFGPNEDYNKYPRQLDEDTITCKDAGVDIIFAPTPQEMYPCEAGVMSQNGDDQPTQAHSHKEHLTTIAVPEFYTNKLCGKTRTGHFNGVATVVIKLFNIVQPDYAFFGQKDVQQLIIIKKIASDLNIPVQIIGCPIVRNADGLACSSRNSYLSSESRQKALSLFKILEKIIELYNSGKKSKNPVFQEALKLLHPDIKLEYLDLYDINTLAPLNEIQPDSFIAIAGIVDGVRLIDNITIK